jgi:SAM-dependent methyltransferase
MPQSDVAFEVTGTAGTCALCDNAEGNRVFPAREMMIGLRDPFHYRECGQCGCLQLLDPPAEWERYYPPQYYSFATHRTGRLKRLLKRWRARHALGLRSLPGALLVRRRGVPPFVEWVRRAGVTWDDRILDIGSGAGRELLEMSYAGFTDLTGVDPFLEGDRELAPGARLLAREISGVEGPFAFAMMNHAFEHMAHPEEVLSETARLLPPGRMLMIRTPVAGSFAWREYGADWVQLDAPRHQFIHTPRSIQLLAERTGFVVEDVRYDSGSFQFWASEQYRRDIALDDERSFARSLERSPFSAEQIAEYESRAEELNARGEGDQACFFLARR